ncbi:MAG: RNA polymerase sigma factor [Muribaculaceae bacterium]|nr:RNA polymerase sigma factor [Muribaculaceae bacterium]
MAKATQLIFQILEAEKDKLFQYASYRLHDIRDVEDVMQNVYVKLIDKPELFGRVENKKAYIYRIVCNECTNVLREKSRTFLYDGDDFAKLEPEGLQPENFEEEFMIINRLLAILPQEQADAIRLRLHSGLSYQEIADVMDVPLPTAKARFRYGIEKIRNSLKSMNLI